ncbi:hypothetical protein BpHYR1_045572 [Brachionus plicatilis]|uniref:Uncharacterized protein n=1 Tax=Brachionus plicatilis TaxID=10195 RepID=A0A3M7QM88_BRAPC|nr:hypothetical protein BpHYR1_045572 [Brachionus plicatilis]
MNLFILNTSLSTNLCRLDIWSANWLTLVQIINPIQYFQHVHKLSGFKGASIKRRSRPVVIPIKITSKNLNLTGNLKNDAEINYWIKHTILLQILPLDFDLITLSIKNLS